MSKERCGSCKFYWREAQVAGLDNFRASSCRRYPPAIVVHSQNWWDLDVERQVSDHDWPRVDAAWWCGEWKPATEGEA